MLSEKFKNRMSHLLGDEYEDFIKALEEGDAVRGFRVNGIKAEKKHTEELLDAFSPAPISYTKDGFIFSGDGIGNTPEHHAGMIYVQDPGAMSAVSALGDSRFTKVLDMCSAPGGKSAQAAAMLSDDGFLLSNEYVPKRAKIVVSNFERLGIKNAVVTSLDTAEFPKLYRDFFELVIADVPCSGEGMFRKSDEALSEWSEENVLACARRQREILENAAPLVADNGYLLYSTCTYSVEENEAVVDDFLLKHPDYELCETAPALKAVTADGIAFEGAISKRLCLARRFYPHKARGEGQFCALMRRQGGGEARTLFKDSAKKLSKDETLAVEKFFSTSLTEAPKGRLVKIGENIVLVSHAYPIPERSVFSAGVLVGEVSKGMLFPSHQFFTAYAKLFKNTEDLKRNDPRVAKYLHGEEIDTALPSGFCSVMYEGAPLGGGKVSGGRMKNHYPKGLRRSGASQL